MQRTIERTAELVEQADADDRARLVMKLVTTLDETLAQIDSGEIEFGGEELVADEARADLETA